MTLQISVSKKIKSERSASEKKKTLSMELDIHVETFRGKNKNYSDEEKMRVTSIICRKPGSLW